MTSPPTIEDIRKVPYFRSLGPEDCEHLCHELVVRSYRARELIAVEDEPCRGFYVLRSGRVRILRTGQDGREQVMRLASAGDTFGEVPVFDGGPNPATIEAIEPCEVILIPSETLTRLVQRNPAVATALLTYFARRLRAFTELVEQISLQTVQNRIARYLYFLAREEGSETAEGIVVPRVITQQDLASLVGSVREVVSRTMKAMEDEGILEVRRRELVIRDIAALGRLL